MLKFENITISGKIAVGTTTLAKNLEKALSWKRINVGAIQREFDRVHHIHENKQGAVSRSDEHEQAMEAMTKDMLQKESHLIYEAWLSGFVARDVTSALRVLLICSHEDIRVDRVVNRENITIEEAKIGYPNARRKTSPNGKNYTEILIFGIPNITKSSLIRIHRDPMETLGIVLDKLGFRT